MDIYSLDYFSDKEIIIYGMGYIAKRFYDILCDNGLKDNVISFTATTTEKKFFEDKKIINKTELYKMQNCIICIAVHESLRHDIEGLLNKMGIKNYIWIYPFMYKLLWGKPLYNGKINVNEVFEKSSNYWFAVRYLAIENYYKLNNYGYDIYIECQSLHCESRTAQKRLEMFQKLIHDWDCNGYNPKSYISIDTNKHLLDGLHRLTLAKYFGVEYLNGYIYKYNHEAYSKMCECVLMPEEKMQLLDEVKLEVIKDAYDRMRNKIV